MLDKELEMILEYAKKLQDVKNLEKGVSKADFGEMLLLLENNIIDCNPIAEELLGYLSSMIEAKKSKIHEPKFNSLMKQVEVMVADSKAEANGIVIVNPIIKPENSATTDTTKEAEEPVVIPEDSIEWDLEAEINENGEVKTEGELIISEDIVGKDEVSNKEILKNIEGESENVSLNEFDLADSGDVIDTDKENSHSEGLGVDNMNNQVQDLITIFKGESVTSEDCDQLYAYLLANWSSAKRDVALDTLLNLVTAKKGSFTEVQAKEIATFTKRHSKTKEVFTHYAEKLIEWASEGKKFDAFKKANKSVASAKDGDITRAEAIILLEGRDKFPTEISKLLNFNFNAYEDYKARNFDNYANWKSNKKTGNTGANSGASEILQKFNETTDLSMNHKIQDLEERLSDTIKRLKIFNNVMATFSEEVRTEFEEKVKKELLSEVTKKEEEELQRLQEEIHRKTKAKKHIELIKFGLRSVEDVIDEGEYDLDELLHYGLPESFAE